MSGDGGNATCDDRCVAGNGPIDDVWVSHPACLPPRFAGSTEWFKGNHAISCRGAGSIQVTDSPGTEPGSPPPPSRRRAARAPQRVSAWREAPGKRVILGTYAWVGMDAAAKFRQREEPRDDDASVRENETARGGGVFIANAMPGTPVGVSLAARDGIERESKARDEP
ncbi:hypothetical protein ACCO45_006753 [Purpureocillium lilacinum]|uniref:Uncharacterized protein n=1 Tax=Purpureocillium lilacinum TaxID=33203 RepID=A0ACC4DQD0_PURLI